jgi:cell fate (sporulation/competence/biofilm development) regulator YlbF (YheA/YmcA/DUF963 family)
VQDISDHLDVLERFEYRYDDKENARYFTTKGWPLEIDSAYKDGEITLEEAEEKFKAKLDKDKERYYKELMQLQKDFEEVQQFGDYHNHAELFDAVKVLEQNIEESFEKVKSFNNRETLFDIPLSDKSDL